MAKQKASKPSVTPKEDDRSGRSTYPIQVPRDLADKIATIASHKRVTQAQLLDPILRAFVLTEFKLMQYCGFLWTCIERSKRCLRFVYAWKPSEFAENKANLKRPRPESNRRITVLQTVD